MKRPLQLDLAFTPLSRDLLPEKNNLIDLKRLSDEKAWCRDLTKWIEFLQLNVNLSCPDIVRKNQAFSLGLQFTDDLTISDMNLAWRGKKQATDVLSFPALDETIIIPKGEYIELGDIIISVPTANTQAVQNHHSLDKELRWLVCHGLLHLLGWDHPNDQELTEMLQCQERLLNIKGKDQNNGDYSKQTSKGS